MKNLIIKDVQGNTYTVEVSDDFVLASFSVEDVQVVDEAQEKDFQPVAVLQQHGSDEVREISVEMYEHLSNLSREIERDCTGLCVFKYRTNERYEKRSIKAWNKLQKMVEWTKANDWSSEGSLDDAIFGYASYCRFKEELPNEDPCDLDYDYDVIQQSDAFQNAIRKACKLLRMCYYSNSLSFEQRLDVDFALSFGRNFVRPEIREEFNDLDWGW